MFLFKSYGVFVVATRWRCPFITHFMILGSLDISMANVSAVGPDWRRPSAGAKDTRRNLRVSAGLPTQEGTGTCAAERDDVFVSVRRIIEVASWRLAEARINPASDPSDKRHSNRTAYSALVPSFGSSRRQQHLPSASSGKRAAPDHCRTETKPSADNHGPRSQTGGRTEALNSFP